MTQPGRMTRYWRWCRRHPKVSGFAAVVLVGFILIGVFAPDPNTTKPAAATGAPRASSPTTIAAPTPARTTAAPAPSKTRTAPKITAKPVDVAQRRSGTNALAVLATLTIKGRAPQTGYTREQFGSAWTDDNDAPLGHNGCDTRNDVLTRDLTAKTFDTGTCTVTSGVLLDPYTSSRIRFRRGEATSTAVQIDHVVALSDAWQTGAQTWAYSTRVELANDPINLLAVDGATNEAKGDGDAATWLPPNTSYRCSYVARQIAVKARYRLWVTPAERDAIARVLHTCPTQKIPTETQHATLTPKPKAQTKPQPQPHTSAYVPPPAGAYYENCDAVRAAGKAPLYRGQPGYRTGLDRDGDGVACET